MVNGTSEDFPAMIFAPDDHVWAYDEESDLLTLSVTFISRQLPPRYLKKWPEVVNGTSEDFQAMIFAPDDCLSL